MEAQRGVVSLPIKPILNQTNLIHRTNTRYLRQSQLTQTEAPILPPPLKKAIAIVLRSPLFPCHIKFSTFSPFKSSRTIFLMKEISGLR